MGTHPIPQMHQLLAVNVSNRFHKAPMKESFQIRQGARTGLENLDCFPSAGQRMLVKVDGACHGAW